MSSETKSQLNSDLDVALDVIDEKGISGYYFSFLSEDGVSYTASNFDGAGSAQSLLGAIEVCKVTIIGAVVAGHRKRRN